MRSVPLQMGSYRRSSRPHNKGMTQPIAPRTLYRIKVEYFIPLPPATNGANVRIIGMKRQVKLRSRRVFQRRLRVRLRSSSLMKRPKNEFFVRRFPIVFPIVKFNESPAIGAIKNKITNVQMLR